MTPSQSRQTTAATAESDCLATWTSFPLRAEGRVDGVGFEDLLELRPARSLAIDPRSQALEGSCAKCGWGTIEPDRLGAGSLIFSASAPPPIFVPRGTGLICCSSEFRDFVASRAWSNLLFSAIGLACRD